MLAQFSKWNNFCFGLKSTLEEEVIIVNESFLLKRFDDDPSESRFLFEFDGNFGKDFIRSPIIFLFPKDSAMYDSAKVHDFQSDDAPYDVCILAPLSTSIVLEVRRKLCLRRKLTILVAYRKSISRRFFEAKRLLIFYVGYTILSEYEG